MITEAKNTKTFYSTEIPSDWEVRKLIEIADVRDGTHESPKYFEHGVKFLTSKNIKDGEIDFSDVSFITQQDAENFNKRSKVDKGDILMSMIGTIGNSVLVDFEPDFCIKNVGLIKPNNIDRYFLIQFYHSPIFQNYLARNLDGGIQKFISLGGLRNIPIPLPPLPEQKAIAKVLSTADGAIHTTEKLIAQKELRKKWLMQQLLSGKIRLKGYSGEVKLKVVGQFLKEISERNKESKITKVLSVTNSRGFISQSDQFDRSVASEDASNYKIVRKGQFAYNPSRVNVGSLDLLSNFDEGILSPMYVVFSTNKKHLLPDFLYFQLKTQWFYGHIPMFVQGSVRDSLSFDGLCSMKFFIPTIEEQKGIVQILHTAGKEISLLKTKAEKLRDQKKWLMQQLLTGKIRVK